MDKYRVTLTAEERADLQQMVSSGKAAARKLTHARILLLADDALGDEHSDEEIVTALGTSLRTVSRIRRQLVTEAWTSPCFADDNPRGRIRSRSRGMSSNASLNWLTAIPRRAVATGPSNRWPTNSSRWAWSIGSASRRCGRR